MAQTVVKDAQIRLDPIISQDVRLESTAPTLEWRETDQTLPDGLFRSLVSSKILQFESNTAVGGDFSTRNIGLQMLSTGVIQSQKKVIAFGGVSLQTTALPELNFAAAPASFSSLTNKSLFLDSTSNRVHWKSNTSVDETVVLASDFVVRETPSGALNGVNVTFTLANTPITGSEEVYLNGVLQEPGGTNDYTISGLTITYTTAPISTDRLRVSYLKS